MAPRPPIATVVVMAALLRPRRQRANDRQIVRGVDVEKRVPLLQREINSPHADLCAKVVRDLPAARGPGAESRRRRR